MEKALPSAYPTDTIPGVFRLVEQLSKKLSDIQRRTMKQTGLTPPQYATLTQLWARDGQPLKDLAAGNNCTPATMTTIVDGLERKGLVSRKPHPDDRRSLQLRLTTDGEKLRETTPSLQDMFNGCCIGLSPDETAALSTLLGKLDAALADWEPDTSS